jgi:hypothetical protein
VPITASCACGQKAQRTLLGKRTNVSAAQAKGQAMNAAAADSFARNVLPTAFSISMAAEVRNAIRQLVALSMAVPESWQQ